MAEKRYSIVRVDGRCPVEEEEDISIVDRIKMFTCFNDKRLSCKNCRYGDTKKQLVLKVAQVIRRYRKNLEVCEYCDMKDEFEIAEKVVEFLGVEE